VADVKCVVYVKQKQQSKCYTWTESGPKKCSETELKRCWTGEVQDQDLHQWTCTNTNLYWHRFWFVKNWNSH